MNSPLFINILFRPISDNDMLAGVSAYGDNKDQVLSEGERIFRRNTAIFAPDGVDTGLEPPFNSTFVDVRRLRNLTPEQAEAIAKEWAIEIKPLPGSNAPSMEG